MKIDCRGKACPEPVIMTKEALEHTSHLHVEKGEIFSIIGPNGAGKTTIFNLITSVFPLSSGKILFNGRDITVLKSHQISGGSLIP